jgi:hypothetical protein
MAQMNPYRGGSAQAARYIDATYTGEQVNSVLAKAFGWMGLGLLITAAAAMATAFYPPLRNAILGTPGVMLVLVLAELGLVLGLGFLIRRISAATATGMFLLYALINGLTLSTIFLIYEISGIVTTFFATAGMFGVMAVWGYTTQRDLTSMGSFLRMGVIGLILASIVNIFVASSALYWLVTYLGVGIFVGLTAYDTQKIKQMSLAMEGEGAGMRQKAAIFGALQLYLDFVLLFIYLLRILGSQRD